MRRKFDHVPSLLEVRKSTIKPKPAKTRMERDFRDTILADLIRKPPPQDWAVRIIYESRWRPTLDAL